MLKPDGDSQAGAATLCLGWERVLLAAALLAGSLAILAVSGTALVVRAAGADPGGASPFVAAGAILMALVLVPWARAGRGPVSAIARRLPAGLDGGLRRRPVATGLLGVLTLVAVVRISLLSCFMADPDLRRCSAYPPSDFSVRHMCVAAYVHAADLSRRGTPNLYAEQHYPIYTLKQLEGTSQVTSEVTHCGCPAR